MDDCAAQELKMLSQGQSSGWAELPDNLVDDISRRLPVLSAITMGRVCKPWQRIIGERLPLSRGGRGLPWFLLTGDNHDELRPCFSILQKNFWGLHTPGASGKYCWGSVEDWLIIVGHCWLSLDLEIYLWNPFSSTKILLPGFRDRYAKMILSASPDDPNCLFLLVGSTDQSVACWTPGMSKWRIMDDKKRLPPFADAAFCNGHFYFVMRDYNIHTLDARAVMSAIKQQPEDVYCSTVAVKLHFHRHQLSIPEKPDWPSHPLRHYLVESSGELLMVCRLFLTLADVNVFHIQTHGFEVFKLDRGQMVWTKMQGLGDRVLFLGRSDSRSYLAKDLGDNVANRIFFMNDGFVSLRNEWNDSPLRNSTSHSQQQLIRNCTFSDWGSFSMDTKCLVPSTSGSGSGSVRGRPNAQPPIWITAPIWWFFCNSKHQHINVARRTGKPLKRTGKLEKKRKTKEEEAHRPEKRRRIK